MKVFANNKVYVQNNDLAYFIRGTISDGVEVPSSILDKVFGKIFIVTDKNRYDFVEFSKPDEIEFFRDCGWMVDYNSFDGMSEEEIIRIFYQTNEERNNLAQSFNELPKEEFDKQYTNNSIQIELLEFKMLSVRDVLLHKQGKLTFPLPEGTRIDSLVAKENILQRVLKRYKGIR